jgi:hypothetical protein
VVRLVLAHLPERLEATDAVRLVLARRWSDVVSEEALDEAQLAVYRRSGAEEVLPAHRSEAWLGQRPALRVVCTPRLKARADVAHA